MDRVVSFTSFEEEQTCNSPLEYWLSRPPEERIGEVERLRREYLVALQGKEREGLSQRLCRSPLVVERERR